MYRKSQQIVILGRCRVDTSVDCELELGKIVNKVHDYDCIPDIKIKERIKGHLSNFANHFTISLAQTYVYNLT